MKKQFAAIAAAALTGILILGGCGQAQSAAGQAVSMVPGTTTVYLNDSEPETITVTATASLNVEPDMAELAAEAQLSEKYQALYEGEMINTGEKRLVLHQLTRGQLGKNVIADGTDKRVFYRTQQERIADFAKKSVPSLKRTLLQHSR